MTDTYSTTASNTTHMTFALQCVVTRQDWCVLIVMLFFFNVTATPESYTLSHTTLFRSVANRAIPKPILDFLATVPKAVPMDVLRTAVSMLSLYDPQIGRAHV